PVFVYRRAPPRHLLSFPTRRSSDLAVLAIALLAAPDRAADLSQRLAGRWRDAGAPAVRLPDGSAQLDAPPPRRAELRRPHAGRCGAPAASCSGTADDGRDRTVSLDADRGGAEAHRPPPCRWCSSSHSPSSSRASASLPRGTRRSSSPSS